MRLALMFMSVAAFAASLPELRIEAAAGGSVLFVRNTSSQTLVTYLIELVDYPGSSFSLWRDEPVAPGEEKRIQITNMTVGAVPDYVKVRAARYADGSTAGVPDKVALLNGRRLAQLEAARELAKKLETGQDLRVWTDSLKPEGKPKYDSPAWVNRAGQYELVTSFIPKQGPAGISEILARVKAAVSALEK